MIGSNGPRMLSIALPHADAWNTWWEDYGNRPRASPGSTSRSPAPRAPPAATRRTSCAARACSWRSTATRASGRSPRRAPPLEGSPEAIAAGLRAFAAAGADEVILVLNPSTEASIRALGASLALLDD